MSDSVNYIGSLRVFVSLLALFPACGYSDIYFCEPTQYEAVRLTDAPVESASSAGITSWIIDTEIGWRKFGEEELSGNCSEGDTTVTCDNGIPGVFETEDGEPIKYTTGSTESLVEIHINKDSQDFTLSDHKFGMYVEAYAGQCTKV